MIRLLACGVVVSMWAACAKPAPPLVSGDVPVIADGEGFKPSEVRFTKGRSAALVFTRTSDETCATEVVFPALGIRKDLPKGQAVRIVVPTEREQTLSFECGMGMYKSKVVVASAP